MRKILERSILYVRLSMGIIGVLILVGITTVIILVNEWYNKTDTTREIINIVVPAIMVLPIGWFITEVFNLYKRYRANALIKIKAFLDEAMHSLNDMPNRLITKVHFLLKKYNISNSSDSLPSEFLLEFSELMDKVRKFNYDMLAIRDKLPIRIVQIVEQLVGEIAPDYYSKLTNKNRFQADGSVDTTIYYESLLWTIKLHSLINIYVKKLFFKWTNLSNLYLTGTKVIKDIKTRAFFYFISEETQNYFRHFRKEINYDMFCRIDEDKESLEEYEYFMAFSSVYEIYQANFSKLAEIHKIRIINPTRESIREIADSIRIKKQKK